jgi:release factor glutamine methyltransferase
MAGGDGQQAAPPAMSSVTVKEAITAATVRLRASGSSSPRLDAELLLAEALGLQREALYAESDRLLAADERARFEGYIQRREAHEPVAYIRGRKAFRTIELQVDRSTLIPRPETETLVEVALARLAASGAQQPRVLDIGTGSGAVALALATEYPTARVVATELDDKALEMARLNATRLGLSDRVEFVHGDLYDGLPVGARFDVIVSNPPYVAAGELQELEPAVRDYEPRLALLGGESGLDFYERIVPAAPMYLVPGGLLAVEITPHRCTEVQKLLAATGRFEDITVIRDLGGTSRVVAGREKAAL